MTSFWVVKTPEAGERDGDAAKEERLRFFPFEPVQVKVMIDGFDVFGLDDSGECPRETVCWLLLLLSTSNMSEWMCSI
jgi:hypothetical protein